MKNKKGKLLALSMACSIVMLAAGCGNTTDSAVSQVEDSVVASAESIQESTSSESETPNAEVSSSAVETEESVAIQAESVVEEVDGFTMYYPDYMVETEGKTLRLNEKPEKIIVLSNAALQIMIRCDVRPIAITSISMGAEYPDWVSELPVISTGKSEVDTESIIAMEPDLVIMGSYLQEDYGTILDSAGIPVYYTSEGPSITYNEVKAEAIALTKSFGTEQDVAETEQEFSDLETRAQEFCDSMEERDAMILFSFPPSYQQTSKGYLGSMLSMLPFHNLSDTLIDPDDRTAPLDLEKLVELDPEVIFAISPAYDSAEDLEASYAEEMQNNPAVWENLQAVKNDQVIYLSNEYVTSKGIQIIDSMNRLMDQLEETFG